jgi:hypothetical protein
MAEILKATDLQNDGRIVAVKMFRPDILADPLVFEAFRRETEGNSQLRRPKIGRPILEGVALDRNLGTSGRVGARAILNEHVFGAELDCIPKC